MKTIQAKDPVDRPLTVAALDAAIERGRTNRSGVNARHVSVEGRHLAIGFEDGSAVVLHEQRAGVLRLYDPAQGDGLIAFGKLLVLLDQVN